MAPCVVLAGRHSVLSVLLLDRTILFGLMTAKLCCTFAKWWQISHRVDNVFPSRGLGLKIAGESVVDGRESLWKLMRRRWLKKNQMVRSHRTAKLGVNRGNLSYIESTVVSSGTSSLPLESGTVTMALTNARSLSNKAFFCKLYFYTLKQITNTELKIPWQQQWLKEKEK